MVTAIISFITGLVIFILSAAVSPNSAPQQTVQYLGFVCAAIFEVGGLIMIVISRGFANQTLALTYNAAQLQKSQEKKKCKKCGETVSGGYTSCPSCGSSDLE